VKHRFAPVHIDPSLPKAQYDAAIMAKIKSRCLILPNGCWEFQGTKNHQGYGFMLYRGKAWPLHRLVLTIAIGPIPKSRKAMHTCDYPPCCNPNHLIDGTQRENVLDSVKKNRHHRARVTHCKRGHKLYGSNVYMHKGTRHCRTCDIGHKRIATGWPADLAFTVPKMQGHYPGGMVRVAKAPKRQAGVCKNGHQLSEENVYVTPKGYRQCRPCRTTSVRRFCRRVMKVTANDGGVERD
jgi:hypothetical protein